MNTRFCASCGTGTQYTAVKPTFCSKCGKGFEAAFATRPKPIVQTPAQHTPQYPSQPGSHRRFVGARGRNVPDPFANQSQEFAPQYGGEEGYISKEAVLEAAESLANTISSSDFVCGTESDGEFHGRLPRLPTSSQASGPKIRRRKKAV